jgi:peptidyl-prolyl cis-trans isomerase SurA
MVEILEQVNKESQLKVRVENVFADTTKKPVLKNFDFKVGVSEVKKDNQTYLVIKVSEVVQAAPKELLEIKGLVAADYQEELMRAWIEALSKRYRVTLNSDSMKQLMKHAE